MDAFLRAVIAQREREHEQRYRSVPARELPKNLRDESALGPARVSDVDPVLQLFRFHDEVSTDLVKDRCALTPDAANARLSRLCRAGAVERVRLGVYRRARREDA